MLYEYSNGFATVVIDGRVLKMNLTPEQATIVEQIFERSDDPFNEIKNFYNEVTGIQEKSFIAEKNTLDEMIETGFFSKDPEIPNVVYRNNLKLSVPQKLVDAYIQAYQQKNTAEIEGLDKFWYRMYLCPVDHARQDAFWFLKRGGFRILPNGLILAGRNVVLKSTNELSNNVSIWVDKVKNKWKQKTANIDVYLVDGEYVLFEVTNKTKPNGQFVANLAVLEKEQPKPIYTDSYTQKMRIVMGEPVSQERWLCDHNRDNICSTGLHFASIDYFSKSSYSNWFGAISVLVAIDPMDLVAIPPQDSYWKGRCCRYLPICKVERNEDGNIIVPDLTEYEQLLNEYSKFTLEELEEKAKTANPQEVETNFLEVKPEIVSTSDLFERLAKIALNVETPSLPTASDWDGNYDDDTTHDEEKWWDDDDEYEENW